MAELIGYCMIAFVMIVWANSRLKKGKDFRVPIIAGIIIYALAIFGARAGGIPIIGGILSIVLLVAAYFVLASKVKK